MDEPNFWNFAFWASMQSIIWNFTPECLCFLPFSHHFLSPWQLCCIFFLILVTVSVLHPVTWLFHFMPLCLCLLPSFARRETALCTSRSCSFLHPGQRACARFFWLHCSKVASAIPFSLWNQCDFLRIYSDTDFLTETKPNQSAACWCKVM